MIKDYYEVFKQRALNKGRSFKEKVQYNSQINFKRFLISSPDAIEVTVNNNLNTIKVASIFEKENDTLYKRFILSQKEDNLKVGDFIYWENSIWLLFKKEKDTINAYDKFEAIECRNTIKWINSFGVLEEVPCYLVSETDNTVQPNFRTWNNMITPQPNKNLNIITSRRNIQLGQKFLIEDTAWHVVESDYISMKGIIFLSLIEDKVDLYDDSINDEVADIVDLNNFSIVVPDNSIIIGLNDSYQLTAKIENNGNLYSNEFSAEIIEGNEIIQIDNHNITCLQSGRAVIRIAFLEDSRIFIDIPILVLEDSQNQESYELDGDETIKWGRTKTYECKKFINGISENCTANFEIEDTDNVLASSIIYSNGIAVTANNKNISGSFSIICKPEGTDIEIKKECRVVSLWM